MIRRCLAAPAEPELIISGVSCPGPVCTFRGVVMVDVVVVDVVVVVVVAGANVEHPRGARTQDLEISSTTPYPLGHRA